MNPDVEGCAWGRVLIPKAHPFAPPCPDVVTTIVVITNTPEGDDTIGLCEAHFRELFNTMPAGTINPYFEAN